MKMILKGFEKMFAGTEIFMIPATIVILIKLLVALLK